MLQIKMTSSLKRYKGSECRLKRNGFTLIELLVVVAIIAVLVAILLPSLSRARNTARAVVCKSNMRNLSLALSYYANEGGYYPANSEPMASTWVQWLEAAKAVPPGTYKSKPTVSGILLCPNTVPRAGYEMLCSFGPTLANSNVQTMTAPCGGMLGIWGNGTIAYRRQPKRVSMVMPGTILLIEKNLNALSTTKFPTLTPRYATAYDWNVPSQTMGCYIYGIYSDDFAAIYRHDGRGNFLFDDLHIEALPRNTQYTVHWLPVR